MEKESPYVSKSYLVNRLSLEERKKLKESLLGNTIKIKVDPVYGLFTEHGFPVAKYHYSKEEQDNFPNEFFSKVIQVNPIITVE